MPKLLRKLISLFIFDKEKKQKFLDKGNKLKKLRRDFGTRFYDLAEYTGFYPSIYFNSISYENGIENKIISNEEEHLENVTELKKNLEPEPLDWITKYLELRNNCKKGKIYNVYDVYDKDDIDLYKTAFSFKQQVVREADYFRWGKYKLPANLFHASVFLHRHGLDHLETFKDVFSEGSDRVIIDAGSYILDSAMVMRDFTSAEIHSFEPTKTTYDLGLKTIELNNLENVVFNNAALGSERGTCQMCMTTEYDPGANFVDINADKNRSYGVKSSYSVDVFTIDDYVKENNLTVGLIKTDVEGFEPELLKGALETIKSQKPMLAISIYHNYHDFYKIKPMIDNLDLGYKFKFFKGPDSNPLDIMLLCEVR